MTRYRADLLIHALTFMCLFASFLLSLLFTLLNNSPTFRKFALFFGALGLAFLWLVITEVQPELQWRYIRVPIARGIMAAALTGLLLSFVPWRRRK